MSRLKMILEVFTKVDYLECRLCATYAYPEREVTSAPIDETQRWRHVIGDFKLPCKLSKAFERRFQKVFKGEHEAA